MVVSFVNSGWSCEILCHDETKRLQRDEKACILPDDAAGDCYKLLVLDLQFRVSFRNNHCSLRTASVLERAHVGHLPCCQYAVFQLNLASTHTGTVDRTNIAVRNQTDRQLGCPPSFYR
jgi:hypothetical protein